ncbi:uncharacterized protein LOC107793106 [Nicotiana tabacum]|uniref:Uncharacterized protein LOC107793106 n=1 Tax=Nicotiana tabacum TaxID=4097 RepID=A0AC58S942_TOBAC
MSSQSIFYSRDVVFHEYVFPFSINSSNASRPSPSSFVDIPPYSTPPVVSPHSASPLVSPPIPPYSTSSPVSFPPAVSSPISSSPSPPSDVPASLPPSSAAYTSYLPPSIPPLRKSLRVSHPPPHLEDYICSAPVSTTSNMSTTELHLHEPQTINRLLPNLLGRRSC